MRHALAGARNGQEIRGGRGVDVERNESVLREAGHFFRVHVLPDLFFKLRVRLPGAVLGKLARHPLAGAGHEQDLFARGGVEVDVHEDVLVNLVGLLLRQLLAEEKGVKGDDVVERPRGDERFRDRRRNRGHLGEIRVADGVGVNHAE